MMQPEVKVWNMDVELSVDFCGITFKNPFILACAPPSGSGEKIQLAAKAGWAGAVEWSTSFEHPQSEFLINCTLPTSIKKASEMFAMENTGIVYPLYGKLSLKEKKFAEKEFRTAKKAGIPIIATVNTPDPDQAIEMSKWREEVGADMIELNLSCPYGGEEPLKVFEKTVEAVIKECSIPIIVKLPPGPASIELAKAAERAGADALCATNTLLGILGVDVHSGVPIPAMETVQGKLQSLFGGISGPALRPTALATVAQLATNVRTPISGSGGIMDWKSAVEFIMLGATTVQSATAPMLFGYNIVKGMVNGLKNFMQKEGYRTIEDFRGKSLKFLGTDKKLKRKQPFKAVINIEKCTNCGRCVIACNSGGEGALQKLKGTVRVDAKKCGGCNTCFLVCPEDAISLAGLPK